MGNMRWFFVFLIAGFFLSSALLAQAASLGSVLSFIIDPDFDALKRQELPAVLMRESQKLSFYLEQDWWNSLDGVKQVELQNAMAILALDFENTIYPTLTSAFGSEWNPGVDGDPRITILVHRMAKGAKGYFRETDEHLKLEFPDSNEREMVYLSTEALESSLAKSFLAHEFTHLITYNQKEKLRKVKEETWLNEARAEYAATLLGYNTVLAGSTLEGRLKAFLQSPNNSLVEWKNEEGDYGVVSLFVHYMVDHYGAGVLIDSLQSERVGIPSLEEALKKNGFDTTFSKVFTDWTLAVFLNDCSYGKYYCYLNQNLVQVKLNPTLHFLPFGGLSKLEVAYNTKNWAGNWLKFVGGQGALHLRFQVFGGLTFQIPYLVQALDGTYEVKFLNLGGTPQGEFFVADFGTKQKALIIIPTLQTKTLGFGEEEPVYPFSIIASILERTPEEEDLIKSLRAQLVFLQSEVARVISQLAALGAGPEDSCASFQKDLAFGMRSADVECLQKFLKNQGQEIYPEGLVTGYFGSLTLQAVVRFQEKYAEEILTPIGFQKGTGYVGNRTRAKMNQLLTFLP